MKLKSLLFVFLLSIRGKLKINVIATIKPL